MNRIKIRNPQTHKFVCSDGEVVEFLEGSLKHRVVWIQGEAYISQNTLTNGE